MNMTLHELLAKFPADSMTVQRVDATIEKITTKKNGDSVLSIVTNQLTPTGLVTDAGPMGLLVWIPRDLWNKVVAEHKNGVPNGQSE
jgi:hypothetical protein